VVNGEPRSLTKTKGDVGLSSWRRRRARSSSPWIGWVLGFVVLHPPDVKHRAPEVDLVASVAHRRPAGRAGRRAGPHFDLRFRTLAAGIGAAAATGAGWT
jgi:hypothetical protein